MSFKQSFALALLSLAAGSGRFFVQFLLPLPLPVPLFGFLPVLWLTSHPSITNFAVVLAIGALEDGLSLSPMGISSASFLIAYIYARWHRRMFTLEGKIGHFFLNFNAIMLGYLTKGLLLVGQGSSPSKRAIVLMLWVHLTWSLLLALLATWLFSNPEGTRETVSTKLAS